ncbi:TIGR01777 family oxidoreductase [Caenimonas koreensis]|uniref:TIGR01777 family oxidoreductase n=1 Tax=Caenimonas koreensis TaxID=367474 RepID=UPI003784EB7A
MNSATPSALWPTQPAVLVTGATGFIGSALVKQLLAEGKSVIAYSRDAHRARSALGAGVWVTQQLGDIPAGTNIDAVVHLAGATVLGQPWTHARRELLVRSRTSITQELIALMQRLQQRPRVLVAASAVGFYGVPAGNAPLDERAAPEPGRFQSDLCVAIEREAQRAEALGVRVVCTRFGIVLGAGGGAYPGLATASRFGLGAQLGDGKQPVPWIHLQDAVGLIDFAITNEQLRGPVNAVAPDLRKQSEFASEMAQSLHRRALLRVPRWALRLGMGEMSELLVDGQWVVPAAAQAAGYRFQFASLREGLDNLAQARS